MSKFVLNEPRGQYLFEIYTSLSYVRVASYTSHTLPCLNIKHLAVKITSKDQQTLAVSEFNNVLSNNANVPRLILQNLYYKLYITQIT